MNKLAMRSGSLAIFLWLVASPAQAGIIWTLNDFVFDDDTTVSGWFEWDTGRATDWSIQTQNGFGQRLGEDIAMEGLLYNPSTSDARNVDDDTGEMVGAGLGDLINFVIGRQHFRISPPSMADLSIPQSRLDLAPARLTSDAGFIECINCSPVRFGLPGAYLSTPVEPVASVPEPAGFALLLTGLLAITVRRRFRQKI